MFICRPASRNQPPPVTAPYAGGSVGSQPPSGPPRGYPMMPRLPPRPPVRPPFQGAEVPPRTGPVSMRPMPYPRPGGMPRPEPNGMAQQPRNVPPGVMSQSRPPYYPPVRGQYIPRRMPPQPSFSQPTQPPRPVDQNTSSVC